MLDLLCRAEKKEVTRGGGPMHECLLRQSECSRELRFPHSGSIGMTVLAREG